VPAHHHHEAKAEEEKHESAKPVLNSDHFVICGKNIFSPPPELVVLVGGVVPVRFVMRFNRSGSVHFRKVTA